MIYHHELRIRRVLRGFCAMIQFSSFDVARAVRWLFRSYNAWLVMVWRPGSLKGFVYFCMVLLFVVAGSPLENLLLRTFFFVALCGIASVLSVPSATGEQLPCWSCTLGLREGLPTKTKNNSVMASTQYLESRWTQWLFKHYTHLFSANLRPSVTISAMAAMEWISD